MTAVRGMLALNVVKLLEIMGMVLGHGEMKFSNKEQNT
jgi:hypothetical protein